MIGLNSYFWQFEKALCKDTCNRFIELGLSKEEKLAVIFEEENSKHEIAPLTEKEKQNLFKKRNSHVAWLKEQWIYELIHPYIHLANYQAGWNFDWDWSEKAQFTIYKEKQFYGWHADSTPSPSNNINESTTFGKIRKITCLIQLTNPLEYEGGCTQIDPRQEDPDKKNKNIPTVTKEQGSIICFPSFVWHRAQPITKGIRYSINMFNWGKPFK
tara:strand:+ start:369 stop:1010 length:642 start_codon:yes stop_codon:yes gene_type:complete